MLRFIHSSRAFWRHLLDLFIDFENLHYNNNDYMKVDDDTWSQGDVTPGEGVYKCHNGGSCIAPDTCSCPDGWDGYDCETPACRHLQPSGVVSSCQNGGICAAKDDCACIATDSVLWQVDNFRVSQTLMDNKITSVSNSNVYANSALHEYFFPCSYRERRHSLGHDITETPFHWRRL